MGLKKPRGFFVQRLAGEFYADAGYNPFKAADEKIALSVVYVNNKPLHLVFCAHSPHLFAKQRRLCVESAKPQAERGVWQVALLQYRCKTFEQGNPASWTRLVLEEAGGKAQKWCSLGVILWRCGERGALATAQSSNFAFVGTICLCGTRTIRIPPGFNR